MSLAILLDFLIVTEMKPSWHHFTEGLKSSPNFMMMISKPFRLVLRHDSNFFEPILRLNFKALYGEKDGENSFLVTSATSTVAPNKVLSEEVPNVRLFDRSF